MLIGGVGMCVETVRKHMSKINTYRRIENKG